MEELSDAGSIPACSNKRTACAVFFVGKGAESNFKKKESKVNDLSSKKAARKDNIIKNAPKM